MKPHVHWTIRFIWSEFFGRVSYLLNFSQENVPVPIVATVCVLSSAIADVEHKTNSAAIAQYPFIEVPPFLISHYEHSAFYKGTMSRGVAFISRQFERAWWSSAVLT